MKAIEEESTRLQETVDQLYARGAEDEALILEAQLLILEEPTFIELVKEALEAGKGPGEALRYAAERIADMLGKSAYMRARRADIVDLAVRIANRLCGREDVLEGLPEGAVILADELFPSETVRLRPQLVAGIATERGGVTAHAAIIARNYGIPAVVGVEGLMEYAREGARVVVDGIRGEVIVDPSPETLREALRRKEVLEHIYREYAQVEETTTAEGVRVLVEANIGCVEDVEMAAYYRADGVGLLRTEFLFLNRQTPPSEDEQFEAYREVASRVTPKPTVIRLLDVGGDKPLPYVHVEEEDNPFLGVRGLRLLLKHEELLRTQVRAVLRATPYGNIWLMAPMVSTIGEVVELRRIVEEERERLEGRGVKVSDYRLGAMVEVPSLALLADKLMEYVDFVSIGTNDLTQYTLAADRCNVGVSHIFDHAHPSVLKLVRAVVEAGRRRGRVVSVCGEAASDPEVLPVLIGLGVRSFSVAPHQIPLVRYVVSRLRLRDAVRLAERALDAYSASEVRELARSIASVSV